MVNSPCKLTSYRLLPTWVLVTITDPDADTWEVVHEPSHSYWKNVPSNAVLVVVVVVVIVVVVVVVEVATSVVVSALPVQ